MTTEELLKDRSKWADGFQTRDGRPVRIYATDGAGDRRIHGAIWDRDEWDLRSWCSSGRYTPGDTLHPCDLIPRPVKRKGHIIMYRDCRGVIVPDRCFPTRKPMQFSTDCLACIEIEFTEGEGLQ